MALPPNALLRSLLFHPHNVICASTSAVLSIKKPETCVSGAFGGDNKTRRALPVIAKRVSLLTKQAPLMIVISSSTIVLWHLATEDYCGIKKEVRLDFLFWWRQ